MPSNPTTLSHVPSTLNNASHEVDDRDIDCRFMGHLAYRGPRDVPERDDHLMRAVSPTWTLALKGVTVFGLLVVRVRYSSAVLRLAIRPFFEQ